jgi:predicted enzyme related to lactoylglutathione lyase
MTNAFPQTLIINTSQLSDLSEFYRKGLDLSPPQATGQDHLGFPFGKVYLGFDLVTEQTSGYPGAISIWFEVDDIESAFKRFLKLGAKVKYPPMEKPWGAVLAALYDLDGNILGLSQRGKNPIE